MTGSTVQTYVNLGYAKAASFIGNIYTQYRPKHTGPAIATRNYITNALAAYFDPMINFPADNPRQYGKAALKAVIDPTAVSPAIISWARNVHTSSPRFRTFSLFWRSMRTSRSRFERTVSNQNVGILPYVGERPSLMTPVLGAWPASVLLKGKKEKNPTGLGSDVPQTEMEILLPYATGVSPVIEPADLLTLSTGIRYAIENVELTDLGYRLRASMVIT